VGTVRIALGALFALGVLGVGCRLPAWMRPAPVESPLPPEVMGEARDFYLRDCGPCHGVDGTGKGPDAGTLGVPPSDLTRLSALHGGTFPREYVIAIVTGEREVPAHGTREMPVWQQRYGPPGSGPAAVAAIYAQRRMELLLRYLESLQRRSSGRR
jgi:hypothetical protein